MNQASGLDLGALKGQTKFNLKIIHKGLILVLVPFLMNGCWVLMLCQALSETSKIADMAQKQANLIGRINYTMNAFIDASGNMLTYMAIGDRSYRDTGTKSFLRIKTELETLARQEDLSKAQRDWVEQIRSLAVSQFDNFESVQNDDAKSAGQNRDETSSVISLVKRAKTLQVLLRSGARNSAAMLALLDKQNENLKTAQEHERQSRNFVLSVVLIGFCANLALAILLVYLFVKDLADRLKILVQNAGRLPSRKPLLPAVQGSDELAYLDVAMHSASRQIETAWLMREALIEMVAHDLRSPLASSQISLEMLTEFESTHLSPDANKQIHSIKSNNLRILAMVNDLLTIEKLEHGQLELDKRTFLIGPCADQAIQTVESLALVRNIQLINECPQLKVEADSDRLQQVFVNYLANAIKFSPRNSTVKITASKNENSVVVSVVDQGRGLSDDQKSVVFEKFKQLDTGKKIDGFGLGLAICRLIIEAHGGRVGVETNQSAGCSFWFSVDCGD